MRIEDLWLTDFRSYRELHLQPAAGLTVLTGDNGAGKTNLLEAIAYLATLRSFRGAPTDALVRVGAEAAVVRAQTVSDDRTVLIEAEIRAGDRRRVQVNRQRLTRVRDLVGTFQVAVFSPDDLELVKGGPAGRRAYLDDLLSSLHPRYERLTSEVDRVLRQRNALLRQARGRWSDDVRTTLDVWNSALVEAGEGLVAARLEVLEALTPHVQAAYAGLAAGEAAIGVEYSSAWRVEGLASVLARLADDELRRGVTLAGPHRDDVVLTIDGMASRTHSSQGEQRSLALALRLGSHRLLTDRLGTPPVLLLDDIFSELDPDRGLALVEHLPAAQTVLTTAGPLPLGAVPELVLEVADGGLQASE